jgi:hypothetical protein
VAHHAAVGVAQSVVSVCADPSKDAGALKKAHDHLNQDEPNDDPLQAGGVRIVAVVTQPAGERKGSRRSTR